MATEEPGNVLSIATTVPDTVRQTLIRSFITVRPSVANADIDNLRDAYRTMQERSENDNRSWVYWGSFHGYNRYDCWHHFRVGNDQFPYDLFLPWHRAYLTYWERTARDANRKAALPWWDWTTATAHSQGIPASFASGGDDPLASGPVPSGFRTDPPRTFRSPGPPSQLPSRQDVQAVLNLSNFVDFSNQVQNIHDMVHGWVGGDMGVIAASAFDPIFWSHHCMIDRLWYLWQLRHGMDNMPPEYLDKVLAPWDLTVRDVLDTRKLGYEYGASRVIVPAVRFEAQTIPASTRSPFAGPDEES